MGKYLNKIEEASLVYSGDTDMQFIRRVEGTSSNDKHSTRLIRYPTENGFNP